MRNILKKNLLCMIACVMAGIAFAQTTTGTYTKRVISSDGKTSTWTFDVVSGSAQTVPDNTDDNGILYINGGGSNKAQTSKYFSFNKSEFYIEVPSGSAGKISMAQYSSGSDGRWFQLYVNGTEGPSTKRLWSKAGDGTDGKKGPQSFDFVSSDITSKGDKTYLYFKTNGTEMKVSSFTITLTTGSYIGPAPKSKDATLSDLKVNGVTIDGFAASKTSYDYSVAATATTAPIVSATKNDTKAADPVITQAALPTAGNPTQATVKVTAEDEETTMTYTITFTRAELSHDATLKEIKVDGMPVSGFSPTTETYNVSVPYSQTAMPVVTATANNSGAKPLEITQPTAVPGSATIKVTAEDGTTTKTYTLNFTRAAASNDATLKELTYNGKSVPGFSPSNLNYQVELANGSAAPTVAATPNHPFAKAVIQQSQTVDGKAIVTVTAEDGNTQKQYTIQFSEAEGVPVPPTDLLIHVPGVYEESSQKGGYDEKLTVFNRREYEVYFLGRDRDKNAGLFTKGGTQIGTGTSENSLKVEWLSATSTDGLDGSGREGNDEFKGATGKGNLKMKNGDEMLIHIKGFDQFTLWGKDNNTDPSKGKYFYVYIDDKEQPVQNLNASDGGSIRRYEISSGEHVIKITSKLDGVCKPYGFSLRVAQQPRVKYIDGNDSTQAVWAGRDLKPVTYFTKYNNMGQTMLTWEGAEATGISLTKAGSDEIGDTLILKGTAACPAGEYHYRVESFTSAGIKTTSIAGKFTVKTQISFMNLADTTLEVYQSEEMDPILFSYYANSVDDITLDWGGKAPVGITGTGANGRYSLAGTPQTVDTFNYTLSVAGGNTIKGQLIVQELNLGDNPVLYLQSDRDAYKQDGIYAYLNNNGYNLIPRVAQSGLRKPEQYAMYNWILISEDADADNGEVLAVTREGANRPVLNMKSFSYAPGRLDWGEPNKGSVSDEGRFITVTRGDHPIFQALHKKQGDRIMVLDTVIRRGLMPIDVHLNGTLCLATALKGDIEDYFADGEPATFLHEIPASMRGGYKYICMPIGISSSKKLTSDGKKLLEAVISYLLSDEQTVLPPTLQITDFRIGDLVGDIDEATNTITININRSEYPEIDLSSVVPTVTLADPNNTFLVPDENEPVDLEWTKWIPVYYTVTDHVGQRTYTIVVNIYSPEGIEEVYSAGEWVNIFDIYGRKVATTNEDIYSMALPHGMYIVVTENGQTLKIMR